MNRSLGSQRPHEFRHGDWYCLSNGCGAHNFASRKTCFRCGSWPVDCGHDHDTCSRSSRGSRRSLSSDHFEGRAGLEPLDLISGRLENSTPLLPIEQSKKAEDPVWTEAMVRLRCVFPNSKERGAIKHALMQLSDIEIKRYTDGDDDEVRGTLECLMGSQQGQSVQTTTSMVVQDLEVKSFSRVSQTFASSLLEAYGIKELNGNELEPIEDGGEIMCKPFDYAPYHDENGAAADVLNHHKKQLELFGVQFGRDHYKMYDLHALKQIFKLAFTTNESEQKCISGGVDGCIAPFGMALRSAANTGRVFFEHKRKVDGEPLRWRGGEKGQAVSTFIAALTANEAPAMLDLTDGISHNLLLLCERGGIVCLMVWSDLKPIQAYIKISEFLLQYSELERIAVNLKRSSIPPCFMSPFKRLKAATNSSLLKEQLESIIPFEDEDRRLEATMKLMWQWRHQYKPELPEFVQHMFI